MHCLKKEEMSRIASIFDGWNETPVWSCLQGYMGTAWCDDIQHPGSAQIITGDFCFFAGKADRELVKNIPAYFTSECIIMVPQHNGWAELIEKTYKTNCERFTRYATKKEDNGFDQDKLKRYIENLPSGYSIHLVDKELYTITKEENWSKYLCSQFTSYEEFEKYGLGFVVLCGNEMVSGASSYTVYNKGIEIEIDTKEEYRRKGLALACVSKLILTCLEKDLYPSWDAANKGSLDLAEKLGYYFDKEYDAYAITDFR